VKATLEEESRMRTWTLPVTIAAVAVGLAAGVTGSAVAAPAPCTADETDFARCATATASSQNTSTSQTAAKAIDGVAGGYPGDHTTEWATVGGRAGSTLTLRWTSPQRLGSVVLNDRPNEDDQITRASLVFSDGTTVIVPELPNTGDPIELEFTPRTVTSVRLVVREVSERTYNVGLSEFGAQAEDPIAALLGIPRTFTDDESVLSVRPSAVSSVAEGEGTRLIRVDLELAVLAGDVESGASDFVMLGTDGTRYAPTTGPADDPAQDLVDQALSEGDAVEGAVYFEVPVDGRGLLIAYVPDGEGDVLATWSLNAP
jgi:hypothetical protein